MSGILVDSGGTLGVESSGVFKGVLVEDMITTVRRVKKSFIDVFIPELFFEDEDYPLTYIPLVNITLPLKKDQEVWVYFNQSNHRYPVFWKLADDFDESSGFLKDYEMPSDGSEVSFPSKEETLEVHQFSDDVWLINTNSYCVLYRGDQCVVLGDTDVHVNAKGTLNLKASTVKIEASSNIVFKSPKVDVN